MKVSTLYCKMVHTFNTSIVFSLPAAVNAGESSHSDSLPAQSQPVSIDRGQFFFAGVGYFPPECDELVETGLLSEAVPSTNPPPSRPPLVMPAMEYCKEAALR